MASGTANLSGSLVDLQLLVSHAKDQLFQKLDECTKLWNSPISTLKRALVIDPSFSNPLSLVAEVSELKSKGQISNFYHLDSGNLNSDCTQYIYIIKSLSNTVLIRYIIDQIKNHIQQGFKQYQYCVYFVPRKTTIALRLFQEQGIFDYLANVGEVDIDWLVLDKNVISMENEAVYKQIWIDDDLTNLQFVVKSIEKLQSMYGQIPLIRGKGKHAKIVADMLIQKKNNNELSTDPDKTSQIGTLFLFDRSVDLITPLISQLTYEGLIDEVYKIKSSYLDVDAELFADFSSDSVNNNSTTSNTSKKKRKVILNSNDEIYSQFRDSNFAAVGNLIHQKAIQLSQAYQEKQRMSTSMSEMKTVVQQLRPLVQQHNSLTLHTNLSSNLQKHVTSDAFSKKLEAEQIILNGGEAPVHYIEMCIISKQPISTVLRLVCLLSLCSGGVKPKDLDKLRDAFLQTYGFEHMTTFMLLEKLGLCRSQESSSKNSFATLRKIMGLIQDVNEKDPQDISYVFSGYAPLSVRFIENTIRLSCPNPQDMMSNLSGPTFQHVQQQQVSQTDKSHLTKKTSRQSMKLPSVYPAVDIEKWSSVTVLYFLGGITFAEIAAVRFLSKKLGKGVGDFVIATTHIVNGDSMMQQVLSSSAPDFFNQNFDY